MMSFEVHPIIKTTLQKDGHIVNDSNPLKSRKFQPVGGELIVRRNREFEKVLGRDASSDNFLKKQLS